MVVDVVKNSERGMFVRDSPDDDEHSYDSSS